MARWNALPEDVRKAVLAMIVVFGGAASACRLAPLVCDPPPPPSYTPLPSDTPTPPHTPPPSYSPTPSSTPMVCDPPPPPATIAPAATPSVTVAPGQHFTGRIVAFEQQPGLHGVAIEGQVTDPDGIPVPGLPIVVRCVGCTPPVELQTVTDASGAFAITFAQPGVYSIAVVGDTTSEQTLRLNEQDRAVIHFTERWDQSCAPLPLAEIRSVALIWEEGLNFTAESEWPGARYRWSVSGGTLVETEGGVRWQPPAAPGRYLLQVVADWGWRGLAVDSAVLIVTAEGQVAVT